MFGLIGVVFFGVDIKKASDEAKQARFDTEKTLQELNETKQKLVSAKDELDKSRASFTKFVSDAKTEMQKHLEEADQSSKRTLAIEQKVTLVQLRVQQFGDSKGLLPSAGSSDGDQGTAAVFAATGARVALVSEVKDIGIAELNRVAAGLEKQVPRDLGPAWNGSGTVEGDQSNARGPN